MISPWLLLGFFVFVSYTTEAIAGFGSIVIAVGLGAIILPIPDMLPVLVPLNLLTSGYLSIKYRQFIHWPTVLTVILPFMALGTLLGDFGRPYLGDTVLKSLFGLLILWFSVRSLWKMYRHDGTPATPRSPLVTRGLIGGAGITHGLFASGGPLLVYALTGVGLEKTALRSTLIVVWLSLNSLLTVVYWFDGSLLPKLPYTLWYIPVTIVATLVGEWCHHRINERQFRRTVFIVLGIAGLFLAIPHGL